MEFRDAYGENTMIIAGGTLFEKQRHPVVMKADQTQKFSGIHSSTMKAEHSFYARIFLTEDCTGDSVPTPKQQVQ